MKKIKDLQKKVADLQKKIETYCAYIDVEGETYDNQRNKIDEWLQSATDTTQEIARLKLAIQKTNIQTQVTIELGGKQVTKCISEWVYRRHGLAKDDLTTWRCLTDKGLKDTIIKTTTGDEKPLKLVRCYSPEQRDDKVSMYSSEPSLIDAKLEVVNAVTDLIE